VVQRGFEIVPEGALAAKLGLPPDTVPPGAEKNPEFISSLFAPGAMITELVEVHGVPPEIVESMPEGEVVEMPALTTTLAVGEGTEKTVERLAHRGDEAAEALEHTSYFRAGGKVFKVVSVVYAVYRFTTAPREEKPKIAGEEMGRVVGESEGAEVGTAACLALAPETEGGSLLVCGVVGAIFGEKAGEKVGEVVLAPIIDVILNIFEAPEHIAEGVKMLGELLRDASEVIGPILGAPGRLIAGSIIVAHQKMAVDNWDLRDLPPALQADIHTVGDQVWRSFADLAPDPFMARLNEPISAFGVSADAAGRIAAAMAAMQHATAGGPGAFTKDAVLAMRPIDFVGAMQTLGLAFVQAPEYSAGFSGRWDDLGGAVTLRLEPLLRDRAVVNPGNWDLSRAPAVNLDDGRGVDLGPAVRSAGDHAWSYLGKLRESELDEGLRLTMKQLGLSRPAAQDIAEGINGLGKTMWATLDADALLESTPGQFVGMLPEYGLPFGFVKEPWEVAKMSVKWVRAGFQPW
jgi:hypothetical protein